jgi:hypothetical protein
MDNADLKIKSGVFLLFVIVKAQSSRLWKITLFSFSNKYVAVALLINLTLKVYWLEWRAPE